MGRRQTLRDVAPPPGGVLFVGINPGIRSAAIGHHFAGYSNRFWKLLFDAGLVPVPVRAEDDGRLAGWGYGLTNVVPRATRGIDALRPAEYAAGIRVLRRKVRRWRPRLVVLIGVTLHRVIFGRSAGTVRLGAPVETFEEVRVVVLPNPSGRNANYSYAEMLAYFQRLAIQSPARSSESM